MAVLTQEAVNFEPQAKSVEELLHKIGGLSWFQIWATVVLILPEIPGAMITMSLILTGSTHLNYTAYRCGDIDWTDVNVTETNFCQFISNCSQQLYDGPATYTTFVEEFGLYCEQAWMVDMVTSVQMAGSTIGALLLPRLADIYGRRRAFFSICLLMGVSGVASAWSPNLFIFAALRFVSGLTIGGMYVVYINYLIEFLTPRYRTICGCVSFWPIGEMLLALIGYLVPSWRYLSLAVATSVLIVPLAFPWIPESPRWLLCQQRTVEATQVFNQIASWNGRPGISAEEVQFVQMKILKDKPPVQKEVTNEIVKGEGSLTKCELMQCFRNKVPATVPQLLPLLFIWFGVSLVYNGVSFNTKNLQGNPYLNLLFLGISELPGPFFGLVFSNHFGRKQTLIGFLSISTFFQILIVVLHAFPPETFCDIFNMNLNIQGATRVLVLLGRNGNAAGFAILACLTAESFPTATRGTYAGTCGFVGNIGGILAPQLVFMATVWTAAPHVGFCLISLLVTIACFGLKETRGVPLCDLQPTKG